MPLPTKAFCFTALTVAQDSYNIMICKMKLLQDQKVSKVMPSQGLNGMPQGIPRW